MNTLQISKSYFNHILNTLKEQKEHDSKCSDAFRVILPNDFVTCYDNHLLFNTLTDILKKAMNDEGKDSWIEYYMWELDFGKNWEEFKVTINGRSFKLETPDDLWDLLHLEKDKG
jgi:hypothetical protein